MNYELRISELQPNGIVRPDIFNIDKNQLQNLVFLRIIKVLVSN